MTTSFEPGSLRIIARVSMPMLPIGTSSHARKTPRACSHRLSAFKKHAMVLAYAIVRSVLHHSFLIAKPYRRTIPYRTAGVDLEGP
jgi:hypothetical protein